MKAYATENGFIFWGNDAYDIVSKMRRADIFQDHESNAVYMNSVARRVKEIRDDDCFGFECEQEFLDELVRLELLTEIIGTHECPLAHIYCNSRRASCFGDRSYCWLKKQEEG